MRRFLGSAWFPFCTALVLAGVTVVAFAMLKPSPDVIGNYEIASIAKIAGWAIGPVIGLLSLILAGILNLIRRIVRLRKVALLHPIIVLLSVGPWVVVAWQLTEEPPFTPIARAVIEFAARPMLWGSLVACLFVIVLSIPLLLPKKS